MSPSGDGRLVAGYLGGACLALLVFSNLGVLALMLTPFALLIHHLAARDVSAFEASHHRFLSRTWLYAALVLLLSYALMLVPLAGLWGLFDVARQAWAAAEPGEELAMVWSSLIAYLEFEQGRVIASLGLALVLHLAVSLLIASWLAVRLIRRWLRWTDRLPA